MGFYITDSEFLMELEKLSQKYGDKLNFIEVFKPGKFTLPQIIKILYNCLSKYKSYYLIF